MMGNAGNPGSMPAADDETNSKRVMQCEMVDGCRLFIFHNHNVTGYEDAACVVLRRRCRRRSRTEVKELLYVKMALQFLKNSCTDSRQTKLNQALIGQP